MKRAFIQLKKMNNRINTTKPFSKRLFVIVSLWFMFFNLLSIGQSHAQCHIDDSSGVCNTGENITFGCRNPNACNLDLAATYTNNFICEFPMLNCDCSNINGCTDANAMNYNPNADCNDGTCEYENNLAPGDYFINQTSNYLSTILENTCNTSTFEVIENTANGETGELSLNENNGRLTIDLNNNRTGVIKIRTSGENDCEANWTFNLSTNNCDDSYLIYNYPWLSRMIDPGNCNGFYADTYRRKITSDILTPPEAIYVQYENSGSLYEFSGKLRCSDFVNDTITDCLANLEEYNPFLTYWSCASRGCTDPLAKNYNPNAECNNGTCTYSDVNNNCPEGDPLQFDWIQEIINSSNGCWVGEIRQFEYSGATYFHTVPGEVGLTPCYSDIPLTYYDCEGNYVCEFGLLPIDDPRWCDPAIFEADNTYTSIWSFSSHFPRNFTIYGCPGDTRSFYMGFETPVGTICNPLDQQIDIDPITNVPVVSNITFEDNCMISFTINGEGQFVYRAGISQSTPDVGETIFTIEFRDVCDPVSPSLGYTICSGELIKVTNLATPPIGPQPPPGQYNCTYLLRTIEPNDETVERSGDTFILSPNTNMEYAITSQYAPGGPGGACVPGQAISQIVSVEVIENCPSNLEIDLTYPVPGEYTLEGCKGDVFIIQSDYFNLLSTSYSPPPPPYLYEDINIGEEIAPGIIEFTLNSEGFFAYQGSTTPFLQDNAEWYFNLVLKDDCETDPDKLLFSTYPWLTTLVNANNCNGTSITDYDAGSYNFIHIETPTGGSLYYQNGTYYCSDSPNYSCVAAYGLTNIDETWTCGNNMPVSGCADSNAINYNPLATEDDGSCVYESVTNCHIDDWTALKALYESTNGGNWIDNTGWEEVTNEVPTVHCNLGLLFGVRLDEMGRVYWLELTLNELTGNIPVDLSNLNNLTNLNLHGNQLNGNIPTELANLSDLETLYLHYNDLTGTIPPQLGNLPKLTILNLSYNQLTGGIPSELGDLENLRFTISFNDLTGCFTSNFLSSCEYITNQNVDGNQFDAYWDEFCQYGNGICIDETVVQSNIFNTYSWLNNTVNPNNCNGEFIIVYDADPYNFIFIQNGEEYELYFQDGTLYCNGSITYNCIRDYGLTQIAEIWVCGNINNLVSGCRDITAINYNAAATIDDGSCQYGNADVFTTYPWLSTYVDQYNCASESITVYDAGSYNFILINKGSEGKLYFENGTYYCDETPSYSCVDAYNLTNVTQTWVCENNIPISGCTDVNAINYNPNATVDDGSCEYETPDCTKYTGTFFYADCGGANYYFIELEDGSIFDPYFAEGIGFTPREGQQIRFDYEIKTDITTPCTISESPITIICFEEIRQSIFDAYPWINTLVNPTNCTNEKLNVYDAGSYNFVSIESSSGTDLYFQNGTYYCSELPGFSCIAAYGLTTIINSWTCGDPIVIPVPGCTDSSASNYNPVATEDDGSCTYLPPVEYDFTEYPWLNALVNPINCADQVEVTEYEFEGYAFIYIKTNNGGSLYLDNGTFYCTDSDGETCLNSYSLTNATTTWACLEGSFQKFDYIYTICPGEEVTLRPDYETCWFPCTCLTPCAAIGPPDPPVTTWLPSGICDYSCYPLTVSPVSTTVYTSIANTVRHGYPECGGSSTGCSETTTNFLVIVEPCPPAKKAIVNLDQKQASTWFNIYPNPTTNKVFIDLPDEKDCEIRLMDISGKVVKQIETVPDITTVEFDVSNLPKGIYLVELKNEANSQIQKLIVE